MATAVGLVGIGATALGGTFSAIGAARSADAQAKMYRYQADVARINQEWAAQQGGANAMQYGSKARQQEGAIKAAQGASGIDVNSGSAVGVQEGQRKTIEADNLTIRSNAARTAYGYGQQAEMYDTAAANVKASKGLTVASSILGTATSVASKWLQGNQMGMWGKSSTDDYASGAGNILMSNLGLV